MKRANVFLLGIVSFLNDLSSEMIMPILPMFITASGGTGLVVGLIGGLREGITSLLNVFSGYWSDKTRKRKIFVRSGYLISSISKLLLSFSSIWQHILIFSGIERVGKGLRTPARDAIIADSMPKELGKGFGIHRALDTSGAILGAGVVFVLFWFLRLNFRSIIFIAAILSFLSLIPLRFVTERRGKPQDRTLNVGIKDLPVSIRWFILIAGIFGLANFSYMFFILKAQELFTGRSSVGMPIILYTLFNVFYGLFAAPFGVLSDKIGRGKVIISGYLLFSLTSLGFALSNSLPVFIVLFVLYGLVHAMIDGNQRAFISELSSEELKATVLGAFHTTVGLVALPASLIAGFLWHTVAPTATFVYGGFVGVIPVVLFLRFRDRFKERSDVMPVVP
ncbi:MAG: MFS transporter [Candidatus Bipolaricaulia bacterium]